MTAPQPGDRIGNYVLNEVIGSGSFGQVWKATHHVLRNTVAIKLLIDPQYVRNFRTEGVVAHGLRHPNIVRVFDIDPYAEWPYMVMELVDGPSLRQVIHEHPQGLPINVCVRILRGLLTALSAAHAGGLIHRDIKPENILLSMPEGDLEGLCESDVKLTDFGLGRAAAVTAASLMQSGSVADEEGRRIAGTLAYMSPEQRLGEPADARGDLYSVAVVLFEMLTGTAPTGSDLPGMVRSDVPDVLDEVFRKGHTRLEWRFASADDMLAALDGRKRTVNGERRLAARTVPFEVVTEHDAERRTPVITPREADKDLPKEYRLELGKNVGVDFVLIPAGQFVMGSPLHEKGRDSDEGPAHPVAISRAFYMGKHLVTQAQWLAVMNHNPSQFRHGPDYPVDSVSWDDCKEFCLRLRRVIGWQVRMPTEAEWEYACRAGTTTPFNCGTTLSVDDANYDAGSDGKDVGPDEFRGRTTPAGQFAPNAWGLHDMHGNLWEWCLDGYREYAEDPQVDPVAPLSEENGQVVRGGSWVCDARSCRSAFRNSSAPTARLDCFGMRLAMGTSKVAAVSPWDQSLNPPSPIHLFEVEWPTAWEREVQ